MHTIVRPRHDVPELD